VIFSVLLKLRDRLFTQNINNEFIAAAKV